MKNIQVLLICLVILPGFSWLAQGKQTSRLLDSSGNIIFSHKFHIGDLEVGCLTCHSDAGESSDSQDKIIPTMDVCGECHDVEDDEECGTCHRHPDDPEEIPNPERTIFFNHKLHLNNKIACDHCHRDIGESEEPGTSFMPTMKLCFGCHDGIKAKDQCELCHGDRITLNDIHPADWRRTHADLAVHDRDRCRECHSGENDCQACHQGDNLTGHIHDLNYMFTHGLDAGSGEIDCTKCHDRRLFCVNCHASENRIPLLHSSSAWLPNHGRAARNDVENCASCHDTDNSTCAQTGCHNDFDGLRGTDARIHSTNLSRFDSEGSWHEDENYFCFRCHSHTKQKGVGFCGYCHL